MWRSALFCNIPTAVSFMLLKHLPQKLKKKKQAVDLKQVQKVKKTKPNTSVKKQGRQRNNTRRLQHYWYGTKGQKATAKGQL